MYDILITGGSGFIGSSLLEKFREKKIILVAKENSKINVKNVKILNVIKKNIHTNQKVLINSKNLKMNFLHIKDVVNTISSVEVKNKLKSGNYLICNKKNFRINKIIKNYNLLNKKKIKYKFENERKINTQIPSIPFLPNWKIKHSGILDIINFLKNK